MTSKIPKLNILLISILALALGCSSANIRTALQSPQSSFVVSSSSAKAIDQVIPLANGNGLLGGLFSGFVTGPIFFMVSFGIIWFNEKRAAVDKRRIKLVRQLLQQKPPKKQVATPASNTQIQPLIPPQASLIPLMYLSGEVSNPTPAVDPQSNYTDPKALKISRLVQVRQYRKQGPKRRDPVNLQWCIMHFSQAGDKTNDPDCWFMRSSISVAKDVKMGEFKISEEVMSNLEGGEVVSPTKEMAQAIIQNVKPKHTQYLIESDYIYFPTSAGNRLSHGSLRVKYFVSKPAAMSIIAAQGQNKQLQPFRIDVYENKGEPDSILCSCPICCCCYAAEVALKPISQVNIVMPGKVSMDQMIIKTLQRNDNMTGILRIVSYFIMAFGIYLFFLPIIDIIGYIPLVGGFISNTVGILVLLAALIVSIPFYIATFSLAWLVYHPKYSIIALIIAILITVIIIVLNQTLKNR